MNESDMGKILKNIMLSKKSKLPEYMQNMMSNMRNDITY